MPRSARPVSLLCVGLSLALATLGLPSIAGAQMVTAFSGQPCTIVGTEGDDVLYGTQGRDVICGLGGDDTIWAGAGEDDVDGGPGDDRIGAGPGADVVHAGDGDDVVWGSGDMDVLQGGLGADRLWGGDGPDFLAADEFLEQAPEDRDMSARSDRDTEANVLGGGSGSADFLYGAAGDDLLYAGEGGGFEPWDGQDGSAGGMIFGFGGDDVLVGRSGPVPIAFFGGIGNDRIYSNNGAIVVLPELAGENGDDLIYGSPYDDLIFDQFGDNRIIGGDGDDVIVAGSPESDGSNRVFGGAGDDDISIDGHASVAYGGDGNDQLSGGSRADRLVGGDGDDELTGFDGNDILLGLAGADRLFGGNGNDTLWAGTDSDVDELHGNPDGGDGEDRCSGGPEDSIDCAIIR